MYGDTFTAATRHNTSYSRVKWKSKRIAFGNKEHTKITKSGDSVWLSLFICNTVVCEAAYAPSAGFKRYRRYSIFKITRMGSMIQKEIKYNLHCDDVRGDFLRPPHGTTPVAVE